MLDAQPTDETSPPPVVEGASTSSLLHRVPEIMAFRAPYLEEKLVKDAVVADHEEAARLFDEVKKYLVLFRADRSRRVPLFSRRVHETWRQFILYTAEYADFCQRFFGEHVPHVGPGRFRGKLDDKPQLTFEQFCAEYQSLFGTVSELWIDERSLTLDTCLVRTALCPTLSVRNDETGAELVDPARARSLLRVELHARTALELVARLEHFVVRELPGVGDEDKLALGRALLRTRALEIAC